MALDHVTAAELEVQAIQAKQVPDLLGLVGHRALGHTGQVTEVIAGEVQRLGSVKQEVHAADGVDRRRRPDPQIAAQQWRGTLTRQLGNQSCAQPRVLCIEMLAAEPIDQRDDLLDVVARTQERLDAIAEELRAKHLVEITTLPTDLSEPAGVGEVIQFAANQRIKVLVNNAG